MTAINYLTAPAPLRFGLSRPSVSNAAPRFLQSTDPTAAPLQFDTTYGDDPATAQAPGAFDALGGVVRAARGLDTLTDGAISNALGLDGFPSPVSAIKDLVGGWIGPDTSVAATAPTTGFFSAGIGPTLGVLGPAALVFGAGLASRVFDKPSVGENFAVRFGRGDGGGLTLREVGMDNSGDTIGRDTFANWTRDVLNDALAGAMLNDNLDGALVYMANPIETGGAGAFGARVGGETRYHASVEAALKDYLTGQHRQGRITGDLPAALLAVDDAVARRGTLADAATPAYVERAKGLAAMNAPGWLAAAEAMASRAQRAFQPAGSTPAELPPDVAEELRRQAEVSGALWGPNLV
ncbi:MAG: hypothetical protein RIM84_26155 [Alphaproteobacteria bacterium]